MINLRKTLVILIFVAFWVNDAYALTGWNSTDAANVSIVDSTTGQIQNGSKAIKLNGEYGQQLNQEITGLTANGNYLLTGYVYINEIKLKGWSDEGLCIVVSDNKYDTVLSNTVLTSTTDGWQKFSLDVKAPSSGSVWVRCYLYGIVSATAYIDNLWFGKAEPQQVASSGAGIVVGNTFNWNGNGCVIDSYNSATRAYNASTASSNVLFILNSKSNGAFTMTSGLKMQGDLQIHPDGVIEKVVVLWGGAQVTGKISNQEELYDMSTATLPTGKPFNDKNPKSQALSGSSTETIDSDSYYDNLQLSSHSKLYISGDVTIVVKSSFDVSSDASVELLPNSSLKLYLKSNASVGGKINENTADPSKMSIYMTGNKKEFQLYGSSKLHGVLDNPKGQLNIWSNSELFGALKCKELSGGGKIHVDLANTFGGTTTQGSLSPVGGGSVMP